MKKRRNSYQGELTPAQIAQGMNTAAANANRLVSDASAFLERRCFPTEASLAILAIEEAGKISLLRSLSLAKTNSEFSDAWKDYRSHIRKNVAWILPRLFAEGARKLDDLKPAFDESSDHPYLLDQIKQIGLYTDCLGQAHWSIPDAAIAESLARMLVKTASLLAGKDTHTEKEVELWVEHMGPVWKKSIVEMKLGLVDWHVAMLKNGLTPEGPDEMDRFVYGDASESMRTRFSAT